MDFQIKTSASYYLAGGEEVKRLEKLGFTSALAILTSAWFQ